MSKETLQRLAAANPVPEPLQSASTPEAQAALSEILSDSPSDGGGARRIPWFGLRALRFALPTAALVAVIVVIEAVSGSNSSGSSLVADAYAATRTDGDILHYVVTTITHGLGGFRYSEDTAQVWVSGTTWRAFVTNTQVLGNGTPFSRHTEEAVVNGSYEVFHPRSGEHGLIQRGRGTNDITQRGNRIIERAGFACPGSDVAIALLTRGCQNPLAMLRTLYRSKQARSAGQTEFHGHRADVLAIPAPAGLADTKIKVLIDPRTHAPLQLQFQTANVTSTSTFTDYERLPLNARTRQLLRMRPHPGAHVAPGP